MFFSIANHTVCQPGFGFTYTHHEIEEQEGDIENVYTVEFVFKRSPAEMAGLKAGDRIIKLHDAIVFFTNPLAMSNRIKATPATIDLLISRKGIEQKITMTKAERSTYLNVCLQGDCINGTGTFVDQEGATYTGPFKNKQREGFGKWVTPSGHTYDGYWKNDKKEGKGIYVYKTDPLKIAARGWIYEGDWKNDSMTGRGKINYGRGDIYSGGMVRNNRSGNGKMILADKTVYEGIWKDDKLNGKGSILLPNGDKRSGMFVDHKLDGEVLLYNKASNTTTTRFYNKGVPQ